MFVSYMSTRREDEDEEGKEKRNEARFDLSNVRKRLKEEMKRINHAI